MASGFFISFAKKDVVSITINTLLGIDRCRSLELDMSGSDCRSPSEASSLSEGAWGHRVGDDS